jgi:hypothetical protein
MFKNFVAISKVEGSEKQKWYITFDTAGGGGGGGCAGDFLKAAVVFSLKKEGYGYYV